MNDIIQEHKYTVKLPMCYPTAIEACEAADTVPRSLGTVEVADILPDDHVFGPADDFGTDPGDYAIAMEKAQDSKKAVNRRVTNLLALCYERGPQFVNARAKSIGRRIVAEEESKP